MQLYCKHNALPSDNVADDHSPVEKQKSVNDTLQQVNIEIFANLWNQLETIFSSKQLTN
jgi:hypothetical protein